MATCPGCGTSNPMGARFCDECGGVLSQLSPGSPVRTISIGRGAGNDLMLPEHQIQVGRQHARVTLSSDGTLEIQDMGSRNGTYVNGISAEQKTVFRLSDQVCLGSYVFNTLLLQQFIAAPTNSASSGQRSYSHRPARLAEAASLPGYDRTFFDRGFSSDGSWMPAFLLAGGITTIALFFIPFAVVRDEVFGAMTALGDESVSGYFKLALLLLPLIGVTLIVLRSMGASRIVVGAVLLGAALPGLGIIAGVEDMIRTMPGSTGWRFAFRWLLTSGTACGLVYTSYRPRDPIAKPLLGIFSAMLALSFFLPTEWLGGTTIELALIVKMLETEEATFIVAGVIGLLPFLSALVALVFLSDSIAAKQRLAAQSLAFTLTMLPAATVFLVFVALAAESELAGFILTAVWFGAYFSYLFLFPVYGGTLLLLGLRRRV